MHKFLGSKNSKLWQSLLFYTPTELAAIFTVFQDALLREDLKKKNQDYVWGKGAKILPTQGWYLECKLRFLYLEGTIDHLLKHIQHRMERREKEGEQGQRREKS